MKILLSVFLVFAYTSFTAASSKERAKEISSLISKNPELAFELALELKSEAESKNDGYGLSQSNFILGYISEKKQGDYGKAIIYYLEAIRYAEKYQFENYKKTLLDLYKNSGVIFRRFKAFDLAEEYYHMAVDLAIEIGNTKEEISINYNLSSVYSDRQDYNYSIETLERILKMADPNSKKYFDILNRLSNTHLKIRNWEQVKYYSNKLLQEEELKSRKLPAYSNHILGKAYLEEGDFRLSFEHLTKALKIIDDNPRDFSDAKAKFELLVDLAKNSHKVDDIENTLSYFNSAEELISEITQKPEYFEIYKSQANLYYELSDFEQSKHYEDLYTQKLNEYLLLQAQIQESGQRYNMDLITKRYFAEVDKQERIASILFYSRLISGTLLFLLIATIAYMRYQKVALRRSIEKELIALKIIE